MGRGAVIAAGNPWYEARMEAAKVDSRLASREGAAEALGMSVSAVDDAELNRSKRMPPEKALLMADTYNAPELLNYYCLKECPIGCKHPISTDRIGIERATVEITKALRKENVQGIKHRLQDIAADGVVAENELDELEEILKELREWSKLTSKLEILARKNRRKIDGRKQEK